MPRFYEEKITRSGHCRIRKRVSSNSSNSSSIVKNYKFNKRVVLLGKRVNKNNYCSTSGTPVLPTWKVIMAAGSKSPMQKMCNFEDGSNNNYHNNNNNYHGNNNNYGNGNNKGKEALSARKLAASLWEINGMHSPNGVKKDDIFEEKRGRKSSEKLHQQHLMLDQFPHRSPVCEMVGSKVGSHRRRSSATSQKLQITEYMAGGLQPIEVSNRVPGENNLNVETRLKDVNNSLIASKELVKVLFRIMSHEEEQSSRLTLVSALRVELDRARLQVDQLIHEKRFDCDQMEMILKEFAEEKAAWKSRERRKIKEAVSSLTREIEIERKLRRQAERLNKKLGAELADTRDHFGRAMKELDGERRAREILEQTCDELARGIGEERIEVEELKKESEKAREEVEKERQMLQLADVLREERVQMKLEEARYEFEEKNAALERLKTELGIYSKSESNIENGLVDEERKNEQSDGECDSSDSELHSIELNMDNSNKCYKWSFVQNETGQADSRRDSVDEVFKGRRSLSEKIQWESICLQRDTSNGIEWDFTAANLKVKEKSEVCENGDSNEKTEEFKRYNPVKSQRLPSFQGVASPTMSTGSTSRLREACSAILQDLAARREHLEGQCLGSKR
ncbi:uncharacterized protein At5g41620-like isoform X2 [Silene latifolia]|uniref:uncharacterized protein At5g41620-like isoform X2 n=1 Tax=Silene latifolia TaxID=37657 RepID=UPI003D7823F7